MELLINPLDFVGDFGVVNCEQLYYIRFHSVGIDLELIFCDNFL